MHKPNNLLEVDIQETLAWDPVIDDRRISVDADHGHVKLTGSVPSYYEKLRAGDDTWTVGGVKTLDNDLLVGLAGAVITDQQVADACRAALDHDRVVPKGSVTPEAVNGIVRLTGRVRNSFQRHAAEFVVARVDGVLGIDNLVAISSEPIASDVAERINAAFRRSAIIDDSAIKVTNDGRTIFLSGMVGSYAAMREALDTAWSAPGVESVVNDLMIEP
ncbi:MAG: BON domain-containing protein [Acidimicrobiales bacterium]